MIKTKVCAYLARKFPSLFYNKFSWLGENRIGPRSSQISTQSCQGQDWDLQIWCLNTSFAVVQLHTPQACAPCYWLRPSSYTHISTQYMSGVIGLGTIGFNTLRPRRNEQKLADDIFKCIFFNENVWLSIKISLKFVPKGPINNIPALVQIMAWRRSGDKPLSESTMVILPTHICVTRPQWVKHCSLQLRVMLILIRIFQRCKPVILPLLLYKNFTWFY